VRPGGNVVLPLSVVSAAWRLAYRKLLPTRKAARKDDS
jgi:hypothetical protein